MSKCSQLYINIITAGERITFRARWIRVYVHSRCRIARFSRAHSTDFLTLFRRVRYYADCKLSKTYVPRCYFYFCGYRRLRGIRFVGGRAIWKHNIVFHKVNANDTSDCMNVSLRLLTTSRTLAFRDFNLNIQVRLRSSRWRTNSRVPMRAR